MTTIAEIKQYQCMENVNIIEEHENWIVTESEKSKIVIFFIIENGKGKFCTRTGYEKWPNGKEEMLITMRNCGWIESK